jgi:mono/diheme cytochrome c family protein
VRFVTYMTAALLAAPAGKAAGFTAGDAQAGGDLFETQHCIQCHSVNGRGGKLAPDLGQKLDRDYTPAFLTTLMWNHAPEMWMAMQQQGIPVPQFSQQSAADLFAYFVAAHYFEMPGDAARGEQVFRSKHCAECHGITSSKVAGAPPVAMWNSLADPIALATEMWDHAGRMREEFAKRKLGWVELTGQDLSDLLVYLRGLPATKGLSKDFHLPTGTTGQTLFQSKGCAGCHTGELGLEKRLRSQTITDIAADMWDHARNMGPHAPMLSEDEMREIIGSIWSRQYFRGTGNPQRGQKVFAERNCATCHNNPSSGAPNLANLHQSFSDIAMISVLWDHGPKMLELMKQRNIPWPRFAAQQMSDLIAYLNSLQTPPAGS